MKKYLTNSKTNEKIYVIENDEHMLAHSSITQQILKEAVEKMEYEPPFSMKTIDLCRIVGTDNCVKTTEEDSVVWRKRKGRKIPSRIVVGKDPQPTKKITVGICKDDDGLNTVFTAFTGCLAPKELNDPSLSDAERPEAETFWATHALVCKPEELEAEEERKEDNINN